VSSPSNPEHARNLPSGDQEGANPSVDAASANGTAGLENMADRIEALGGQLVVDSRPGDGTRVRGSVPATPEAPG